MWKWKIGVSEVSVIPLLLILANKFSFGIMLVGIVGIVVTIISIIQSSTKKTNDKHQKKQPPRQGIGCFLIANTN